MENISAYLPGILLAYGAFLIAIASPGPNVLAVIGTSMAVNRPSGMALAMGVATGTLTWAVLTAIGLSALLATYASAILVIKVFGGLYLLYLLWLAYKAFRSAASAHDIDATELAGCGRHVRLVRGDPPSLCGRVFNPDDGSRLRARTPLHPRRTRHVLWPRRPSLADRSELSGWEPMTTTQRPKISIQVSR